MQRFQNVKQYISGLDQHFVEEFSIIKKKTIENVLT